jgi:hypothetical protein
MSGVWTGMMQLLVAIFIVCVILAAFERPQVQESFVSAVGGQYKADCVGSADTAGSSAYETQRVVECTEIVEAKQKKSRYALPENVSRCCLKTYEDPDTSPVFLDEAWAAPDAPSHVGTLLPTFHFAENQGFE